MRAFLPGLAGGTTMSPPTFLSGVAPTAGSMGPPATWGPPFGEAVAAGPRPSGEQPRLWAQALSFRCHCLLLFLAGVVLLLLIHQLLLPPAAAPLDCALLSLLASAPARSQAQCVFTLPWPPDSCPPVPLLCAAALQGWAPQGAPFPTTRPPPLLPRRPPTALTPLWRPLPPWPTTRLPGRPAPKVCPLCSRRCGPSVGSCWAQVGEQATVGLPWLPPRLLTGNARHSCGADAGAGIGTARPCTLASGGARGKSGPTSWI